MMMIEDDERWREDAELWISIHYVLIFLLGSNTIIFEKCHHNFDFGFYNNLCTNKKHPGLSFA